MFDVPSFCMSTGYATHSLSASQAGDVDTTNTDIETGVLRSPEWGNPKYEHPWYTSFENAASVWAGTDDGLKNTH